MTSAQGWSEAREEVSFCYSPLREPGNTRLLRLMPNEDKDAPIICGIFEYPLQKRQPGPHLYEALSYVWGGENNKQPIYIQPKDPADCTRRSLLATANLHAALSHLRDEFLERALWIDAICINQQDNVEKGLQVQSMARVYANATRVVVWLGDANEDGEEAIREIAEAADRQESNPANHRRRSKPVISLLSRPWFQRIWVVQEIAAARSVLVKCGSEEISGHAFCEGLRAMGFLHLTSDVFSDMRVLILPTLELIRRAALQLPYRANEPGSFTLSRYSLGELVDMYHVRKATDRRDMVYALLGMANDDPGTRGLIPNYEVSWDVVFRVLVSFCLSSDLQLATFGGQRDDIVVIRGKGTVLGIVSKAINDVPREGQQQFTVTWINTFRSGNFDEKSSLIAHPSAEHVTPGDIVYLLQGASSPTIIRVAGGFSMIVRIALPLPRNGKGRPRSFQNGARWPQNIDPRNLVLVWDWEPGTCSWRADTCSHDVWIREGHMFEGESREIKIQKALDRAIRVLDCADLQAEAQSYLEEGLQYPWTHLAPPKLLQQAFDFYHAGLAAVDPRSKPPSWPPVEAGHDSMVRLLLPRVAIVIELRRAHSVTWRAAEGMGRNTGAEVRMFLRDGDAIRAKDHDGQELVWIATEPGHRAAVSLLIEQGHLSEVSAAQLKSLSSARNRSLRTAVNLHLKGAAANVR